MRKISIYAILSLAFSLLTMAQNVDTLPKPPTARDTIIQNEDWSIRAPLSEEELEKREENRARVERMKQRFRAFQTTDKKEREDAEQEASDEAFLWSDAQEGGQKPQPDTTTKGDAPSTEDTSLRLEIGRNLQFGKSVNPTPSSAARPRATEQSYPAPEAYNQQNESRINTNPTEIQRNIKSAFQTTDPGLSTPIEGTWQVELDATPSPKAKEEVIFAEFSAGQSYLLEIIFEDRQHTLSPESFTLLDSWGRWLKQYPGLRLEVRAYTHHEIDQLDAIDLSIQRAKTVADYWLSYGALEQQLTYRGYGSLSPRVPNTDPAAKQKNERIEVIILELPTR